MINNGTSEVKLVRSDNDTNFFHSSCLLFKLYYCYFHCELNNIMNLKRTTNNTMNPHFARYVE